MHIWEKINNAFSKWLLLCCVLLIILDKRMRSRGLNLLVYPTQHTPIIPQANYTSYVREDTELKRSVPLR